MQCEVHLVQGRNNYFTLLIFFFKQWTSFKFTPKYLMYSLHNDSGSNPNNCVYDSIFNTPVVVGNCFHIIAVEGAMGPFLWSTVTIMQWTSWQFFPPDF